MERSRGRIGNRLPRMWRMQLLMPFVTPTTRLYTNSQTTRPHNQTGLKKQYINVDITGSASFTIAAHPHAPHHIRRHATCTGSPAASRRLCALLLRTAGTADTRHILGGSNADRMGYNTVSAETTINTRRLFRTSDRYPAGS